MKGGTGDWISSFSRYKSALLWLVMALVWAGTVQLAFAQDPAPAPTPGTAGPAPGQVDFWGLLKSIELLCIPALTTLGLQAVKRGISFIPDWALPYCAPVIGALIDILTQATTGINLTPAPAGLPSIATAALLGGPTAVWMHQVKVQTQKRE